MKAIKTFAKRVFQTLGYELWRTPKGGLGINAFADIQTLTGNKAAPLVVDVGANVGDTTLELRRRLPTSVIHAFEPNPDPYKVVEERTRHLKDVRLNQFALGSTPGTMKFYENESWAWGR